MIAALVATTPFVASAQTAGSNQGTIYMLGIKCYIANGVAASDRRYNARSDQSAALRASGKKSYEFIWFMGRKMGKTDALIQEDIDSYGRMMPPSLVRDDTFFQRTRYECQKIGLM